ncbi:MAG TPA: hypothetical protein VMI09_06240 [Candidatus Binataceae bacterium]|nr:hypothetical protein [Candidatus Binataceae bacterium]
MVELSVGDGMLKVEILGWHKVFALKSRFLIPLAHVGGVRRDPEDAGRWWKGWRLFGTAFPGVVWAGWFYKDGRHTFWDVSKPENAIAIDLINEGYSQLIVEVADPDEAASLIRGATGNFPG